MNVPELLRLAYGNAADHSTDRSSQNGAVLLDVKGDVIAHGWNSFPPGVLDFPERHQRPTKYAFTEHAERRAIYRAARWGHPAEGGTLVCPWFACADCARAIVESGVAHVVGHKARMDLTTDAWKASVADGFAILAEGGVTHELYDGPLEDCPEILVDGRPWRPL